MANKFNYDYIKQLVKKNGGRNTDYLVLSPEKDPFYQGTPGQRINAEWFREYWEKAALHFGVRKRHPRGFHYYLYSIEAKKPDNKIYTNTDPDWEWVQKASKSARYLGLVPFEEIIEQRNPDPIINVTYGSSAQPLIDIYEAAIDLPDYSVTQQSNASVQPYHIEVWCEKSTMDYIFKPICAKYAANFVPFAGQASIVDIMPDLVNRIQEANKPTRIFYIADFDPSGENIPVSMARKLQWCLGHIGSSLDVRVQRLGLTKMQCEQYNLPRAPIKPSDLARKKFEEKNNEGATELDALEALVPGELEKIIDQAFSPYYSQEAESELSKKRYALHQVIGEKIEEIKTKYEEEIGDLEALKETLGDMNEELFAIDDEIDTSIYAVEQFEPLVKENDGDWLYVSSRSEEEQLEVFQEQLGKKKPHKI